MRSHLPFGELSCLLNICNYACNRVLEIFPTSGYSEQMPRNCPCISQSELHPTSPFLSDDASPVLVFKYLHPGRYRLSLLLHAESVSPSYYFPSAHSDYRYYTLGSSLRYIHYIQSLLLHAESDRHLVLLMSSSLTATLVLQGKLIIGYKAVVRKRYATRPAHFGRLFNPL